MTEPNQETTSTTATETPPIESVASFDERLARIHEQVRAEKGKAAEAAEEAVIPAADQGASTSAASVAAPQASENGVVVQQTQEQADLERIRAERHANLQRLKDTERAADEKRRMRARPQAPVAPTQDASEVAQLRAQLASYESAFKDEVSFIAAAREKGLSPTKFGEILKETLANPEFLAEQKVKNVTSSYEQKLLEAERRIDQKVAQFQAQQAALQEESANAEAARELIEHSVASARVAPLAASFLQRHGAQAYIDFATTIANTLPVGCGLDRVHDAIEVALEHLQFGSLPAVTTPPPTSSKTQPPDAKGKAKMVTNQLASSRTTVPDDDVVWETLPFEERLKRLKK